MKISINSRYVTKGSMSSRPKVAFCVKDLGTQKYYAVEGQADIFCCNEFGINQNGMDQFNLVAPYKPKRRVPKVGDRVVYKQGKYTHTSEVVSVSDHNIQVVGNILPYNVIDPRQIVKFLNNEDSCRHVCDPANKESVG